MDAVKGTRQLVTGAAVIAVAIIVVSVLVRSDVDDGWLHAARYTARWSFLVFLVAYLGPAVIRGFGEARTRAAILAFCTVHIIHLGTLVTYRVVLGEPVPASAIIVGGLAYVLIVVLGVREVLGRSSRVFRLVAMNYALTVFIITYSARLNTADQHWVGVAGTATGAAAFAVRLIAGVRARGKNRTVQSVP